MPPKGKTLPYMPLWVADFFSSPRVMALNPIGRGIYLQLLAHEWQMRGEGLPGDFWSLWRLLGGGTIVESPHLEQDEEVFYAQFQFRSQLEAVMETCFEERDGRLFNSVLETILEDSVKAAEKRSKDASEAARKRWDRCDRIATAMPTQCHPSSESESDAEENHPDGSDGVFSKPDLEKIRKEDLKDPRRTRDLHDQAASRGCFKASERTRLGAQALAASAIRRWSRTAVKRFHHRLTKGKWDFVQADEDWDEGRRRLKSLLVSDA